MTRTCHGAIQGKGATPCATHADERNQRRSTERAQHPPSAAKPVGRAKVQERRAEMRPGLPAVAVVRGDFRPARWLAPARQSPFSWAGPGGGDRWFPVLRGCRADWRIVRQTEILIDAAALSRPSRGMRPVGQSDKGRTDQGRAASLAANLPQHRRQAVRRRRQGAGDRQARDLSRADYSAAATRPSWPEPFARSITRWMSRWRMSNWRAMFSSSSCSACTSALA